MTSCSDKWMPTSLSGAQLAAAPIAVRPSFSQTTLLGGIFAKATWRRAGGEIIRLRATSCLLFSSKPGNRATISWLEAQSQLAGSPPSNSPGRTGAPWSTIESFELASGFCKVPTDGKKQEEG